MASIPWWRQEIAEIVCIFEKELPASFMDLWVHLLIHLPDKVELAGVVSCHLMFFLERYIKKLKWFVRQMAKPKDSMAKWYIVYESFYYASEYIKQIVDTKGEVVWEEELDEDKREGELLQMNGKRHMIKSKPFIFCQIIYTEKLFTLKSIIYIWSHITCLELLYTSANVEIDAINKFMFYKWRQCNHGCVEWREKKEMGQW